MIETRIRVLIAEGHPSLRQLLRATLRPHFDLDVVGVAGTVEETIELASRYSPSAIVLDGDLPGTGGVDATKQILTRFPAICVVAYGWPDRESAMLAAGAHRFVSKAAAISDLINAVHAAR